MNIISRSALGYLRAATFRPAAHLSSAAPQQLLYTTCRQCSAPPITLPNTNTTTEPAEANLTITISETAELAPPAAAAPSKTRKPRLLASSSSASPNSLHSRSSRFVRTLCAQLPCTTKVAQSLVIAHPEIIDHTDNVAAVCRYAADHQITVASLLDNVFLFGIPVKTLAAKLPLLQVQQPRDINDFVPLLRGSLQRLNKMRRLFAKEAGLLPGGHRVYYLADRLQLPAAVVAQHMSTHLFMFDLPVEQLIENLDVQLRYNVAPINILRDPWAFRYSNQAIEVRLDRAAGGHKDKLMPWMVRCPETILAKSIQHSVDEKELLGDGTLVDYVAARLGFDVTTTKFILDKHPQIYTVRVTKVKEILDYFLLESEEYGANDVAQVPRILCHSLQTTRTRIEELRSLGCRPMSLVVVCRSANEYRKYVDAWCVRLERMQKRKSGRSSSSEEPQTSVAGS